MKELTIKVANEPTKITVECACQSCDGTGLYVGMAERDGAAIVCHSCKGEGKQTLDYTFKPFRKRKERKGIKRVLKTNPGIMVGALKGSLDRFGGMDYSDWQKGKPFPKGSEMREYTCPRWWAQSTGEGRNFDNDCGWGTFSSCKHFATKEKCWEKWDKK